MTEFYAPDGGYVDLPGGDGPGSTVPLDGPRGRVLRFTTDEWERRAAVAEQAADLVFKARRSARVALLANDFGDCSEGRSLHAAIKALLEEWSSDLWQSILDTTAFAASCRAAGDQLARADTSSKMDVDA